MVQRTVLLAQKADEPVTDSGPANPILPVPLTRHPTTHPNGPISQTRNTQSDQNTQQNTKQNTGEPNGDHRYRHKGQALVDTVLAEPANDHDIDLVQRRLGRYHAAWSPWGAMRLR